VADAADDPGPLWVVLGDGVSVLGQCERMFARWSNPHSRPIRQASLRT
jgi:hypothetical protein